MEDSVFIFAIGFLAQIFFSARTLLQWFKSEKAREIVSPASYWVLSVAGSWLFFIYGWLRDDFAIIFGQFISYYIYLWNLKLKGVWQKFLLPLKLVLLLTPVAASGFVIAHNSDFISRFIFNEDVPIGLLLFGSAGQVIFTFRFVYQWIYSVRRKESLLPLGFWIISLIGSSTIIAYGVFRLDPVLVLGQSFGFVAYTRNLIIGLRSKRGGNRTGRTAPGNAPAGGNLSDTHGTTDL